MFYEFSDDLVCVDESNLDFHYVNAGFVNLNEFLKICDKFSFSVKNLDVEKINQNNIASSFQIYDDYIFSSFKIIDFKCDKIKACVGIFVKKDFFLVVNIKDDYCIIRDSFFLAIKKYSSINMSVGKLLYAFLDNLIKDDNKNIEDMEMKINHLEELVFKDKVNKNLNLMLLKMKKETLKLSCYYSRFLEITLSFLDNEIEIFDDLDLKYISNFSDRIKRLKEDVKTLKDSIIHLQDAYSSFLDLKLNNTMKIFTIVTTVFFPLTLIVGWYGMNFNSMPEFSWKYGYIFVIILSIGVISVLIFIMKKKKWI